MKTPKRTPWQHTTQPCLNADGELRCTINEQHARWKRKNRIKQLKRTIERLSWENFHMKSDLHIPVNISYDEYHSRRVDFTERTPEPYIDFT